MEVMYSDQEIAELMRESKVLPNDWRIQVYKHEKLIVEGNNGNTFCIRIRQNNVNPLDFSVILTVCVPLSNQDFRLRRYNGSTSPHNNPIEKEEVVGFHIHFATERYQLKGLDEETYANQTTQYCDLDSALQCLLDDANFEEPPQLQLNLF